MGLLSTSVSITRYKVEGKIEGPVLEVVADGLKRNTINEIDNESFDKAVGWTSLEDPFAPNFDGSSFSIGTHMVFSLRIDKKSIPSKVLQKHFKLAVAKRLAESGREFLSRNEKTMLKEHVKNTLSLRIPATPNMYDVIWNYEGGTLLFFSNQKAANEELETLFSKSFKLSLIRLFPYTMADLTAGLGEPEKDVLAKLTPTKFTE